MLDGKGTHLLVTGTSKLDRVNKSWAKSFLSDMVGSIGMTIIFGPQVDIILPHKVTGFIILVESHASIHWTRPVFYLDLFSCRAFEVSEIILWVTQEWQMDGGYYQVIERGWKLELNPAVKTYTLPLLPKALSKVP